MNPNWRGGITTPRKADLTKAETVAWRRAVFQRDKFTCKFCGHKGGHLQADHIKPWCYFPELRYAIANGRTLCLLCHRTTFKDVFRWRQLEPKSEIAALVLASYAKAVQIVKIAPPERF
jgi:hypothetical protein